MARLAHTCQYNQPCEACAKAGRAVVGSEAQAAIRKAMEQSRNYRGQEHIESVKLPFHMQNRNVHSYGPNGECRFITRRAYIEAGRAAGMVWD